MRRVAKPLAIPRRRISHSAFSMDLSMGDH
jgi:hypothetical protein